LAVKNLYTEFLKRLSLFSGLADHDLKWLIEQAKPIAINAGDVLIEEGTLGDSMFIILDGEFEVSKRSAQQDIKLDVREQGAVIGEMSLLDHAPRSATVRALKDGRLLMIDHSTFDQLLASSPTAAMSILHTVTSRLRQNEALLHQREKMAGLGTLAAGLAHELNNPAAAAQRSVDSLRGSLAKWQQLTLQLDHRKFDQSHADRLNQLRDEMERHNRSGVTLNPIERSDHESELQAWLEDQGIDDAYELAPTLFSFGLHVSKLKETAAQFAEDDRSTVLRWLAYGYTVYSLLDEVGTSSQRISEIVKAVKSYSYLDQAPVQEVNAHDGLENTLIILKHKLKHGINVVREYDPDLPRIEAYASELNQIWTNIIDNAIDAMHGQGEINLKTYQQTGNVVVEICDNGPGIPSEIQARIFEPFFTTKAPGIGTGLGLNIAYNIVQKHRGLIKVDSQPGRTCFQVTLPIRLK
jgi:signal transduction histidine kinase